MIALCGARLCDPLAGWDQPADIYVADGRVQAVLPAGSSPPAGAWQRLDYQGHVVVPGPIDALCELSAEAIAGAGPWSEDPLSLAQAAAAGGWTALLVYTGSADPAVIAALRQMDLPVRLYPVARATVDGHVSPMAALQRAGAVAVSDWPASIGSARLMRRVLEYAGSVGLPVIARPEDPELAQGGVMHEGTVSFALGLRGIPAVAEAAAAGRDILLQRAFGGRLHLAAVSAAATLELLEQAGGAVTAAVQAHHLLLTDEAVRGFDPGARLDPPLRTETDRQALQRAVAAGRLLLVSGHRPHPPEAKLREYEYAPPGVSSVETALAIGMELLPLAAFVRAVAAGPAQALGLGGGSLRPGAAADLTVFDTACRWQVSADGLRSRDRVTPLAGRTMVGRAVLTLVAGRVAFAAGGAVAARAVAGAMGTAGPVLAEAWRDSV